jgi:hypothetical protein
MVRGPRGQEVVHANRGGGGRCCDLDLHYPKVDSEKRKELFTARQQLLHEKR